MNMPTPLLPPLEFEEVACYLCGSREATPFIPYLYSYQGVNYRLMRCLGCGLLYYNPRLTKESLPQIYSQAYFEGAYAPPTSPDGGGDPMARRWLVETNLRIIKEIERRLSWPNSQPKGRLLEVGCAGGFFLAAAQEAGWEVTGVDISNYAASFARNELGLSVITGTVEEADLPAEHFDLIYMADVLEHLPEPLTTLAAIHRLLRPGGWLVVTVPLRSALYFKVDRLYIGLRGRVRKIERRPSHLFEFTPPLAPRLIERGGFRVASFRVRLRPLKGGIVLPRGTSKLERAAFNVVRLVNYPLTSLLGLAGDQMTLYAQKPAVAPMPQATAA